MAIPTDISRDMSREEFEHYVRQRDQLMNDQQNQLMSQMQGRQMANQAWGSCPIRAQWAAQQAQPQQAQEQQAQVRVSRGALIDRELIIIILCPLT